MKGEAVIDGIEKSKTVKTKCRDVGKMVFTVVTLSWFMYNYCYSIPSA